MRIPLGPDPRRLRAGATFLPTLIVLVVLTTLFVPFLFGRAAMTPTDGSEGRSEGDPPFTEALVWAEEDLELDIAAPITQSSEDWFGPGAEPLAASGLIELDRLEPGRRAYDQHCVGCHGVQGDGAGPAARHLHPRPRNFRKGKFKFTSTDTGSRPRRDDLFKTVTNGLIGSSMPSFRLLSHETRLDLVEYVRYLSIRGEFEELLVDIAYDEEEIPEPEEWAELVVDRWSPEETREVFPQVPEPPYDEESVARGRELFGLEGANCAICHGDRGRGDGENADEYSDDWGYPIRPRDLTEGKYRVGPEPTALYLAIATGIGGTPMPAYAGSIEPVDIWHIVHFIQSLAHEQEEE